MSKTVHYQGRNVEVEEVDVLTESERWNEYQLADGKVLRIKTVLLGVARAVNERTPDGAPLYITKTHNVVEVK